MVNSKSLHVKSFVNSCQLFLFLPWIQCFGSWLVFSTSDLDITVSFLIPMVFISDWRYSLPPFTKDSSFYQLILPRGPYLSKPVCDNQCWKRTLNNTISPRHRIHSVTSIHLHDSMTKPSGTIPLQIHYKQLKYIHVHVRVHPPQHMRKLCSVLKLTTDYKVCSTLIPSWYTAALL